MLQCPKLKTTFQQITKQLQEKGILISKLGLQKILTKNGLNGSFKSSSLNKLCIIEKVATNLISAQLNKHHGKDTYKVNEDTVEALIELRQKRKKDHSSRDT